MGGCFRVSMFRCFGVSMFAVNSVEFQICFYDLFAESVSSSPLFTTTPPVKL